MSQIDNLVFVGFNNRVAALDAGTGDIVWQWKARKVSGGYVTLMLLGDRQLIAAVDGYIYCLDPMSGEVVWYNETKGFGTGVTSLVATRGRWSGDSVLPGAAATTAARAAAAGS